MVYKQYFKSTKHYFPCILIELLKTCQKSVKDGLNKKWAKQSRKLKSYILFNIQNRIYSSIAHYLCKRAKTMPTHTIALLLIQIMR